VKTTILLLLAVAVWSTLAWSQATVNESLETAHIYVDTTKGNDSNPGTQKLPLKTIGAAAAIAQSNNLASIGTKVIINPGTYREAVNLTGTPNKTTTLPMTFQAATAGTVIISGADVWTGWKAYGTSGQYTNSWPYTWGLCPADVGNPNAEEDIARREEMIFVNGYSLTQVMTSTAMRQSTFYVDETHATVYIWPPSSTNMSTATIEVATRPSLFWIQRMNDVVLRGLIFEYANTCRGDGAVHVESDNSTTNVLVDTDFFRWNNSSGIRLMDTTNTTVQNSVANHNGVTGTEDFHTSYALWQNNRTLYNGWRGAQGVYYNWGSAGTHFATAHNQTVKNIVSAFNQTFGFHWDTDNQNDTADSIVSNENLLAGGFVEQTEGPVTISNSSFCAGNPYVGPNNVGIELRNAALVTLTADTLLNDLVGLFITGQAGGIPIVNWENGETYNTITENTTLTNNIFDAGATQELLSDGSLGGSDWTDFQTTLVSDYNTWWNSSTPNQYSVPVPASWTRTNLSGWQGDTGQDVHSTWAQPGNPGSACNITPQRDFWFVMEAKSGYQTVTAGQSYTYTTYIVPFAFDGTVTLDSDGLQGIAGMTGAWSTATVNTTGSPTFTVNTTTATPPGSYPITLIASDGKLIHTMTVTVTVQ